MRKLQNPSSQIEAERQVVVAQRTHGVMKADIPASEVGNDNFALLNNMHSFREYLCGRTGYRQYSATNLPQYKTGLTASKTLTTITLTVGAFAATDAPHKYFVWPDGEHDEIVAFVNVNQVTVRDSGTKASVGGCGIRSAIWACEFNKKAKRVVIQLGTLFYWADYALTAWAEIYREGVDLPREAVSEMREHDAYVFCFNYNGIFKLRVDYTYPYFYRINSPVPFQLPTPIHETAVLVYGRNYSYTTCRLIGGKYHGNRIGDPSDNNVPQLIVEQETGSCRANADGEDYAETFTQKPVGLGQDTHGLLIGGHAAGVSQDVTAWRALGMSGFRINMNAVGAQDIIFDLSIINQLQDIADLATFAMQVYVPESWCRIKYEGTAAYFLLCAGEFAGSTFTAIGGEAGTAPATAGVTDLSAAWMKLRTTVWAGAIATALTTPNYYLNERSNISGFKPALSVDGGGTYNPRDTHYAVYGSLDKGENGTDNVTGIGNNPEALVLVGEVPMCKAVTATKSATAVPELDANNVVACTVGRFSQHDVGCTIYFQSGVNHTIRYLTNAAGVRVFTPTSQYAKVAAGAAVALATTAVIGTYNDDTAVASMMTASKAASTVTRASGTVSFAATDVGKPLFWADGDIDWITGYANPNVVTVLEPGGKASQGLALTPTTRIFSDVVTDQVIKSREKFFLLQYRFWKQLPACDVGVIIPGFIAATQRFTSVYNFTPLSSGREYIAGYYHPGYMYDDKMKNPVQELIAHPDKLSVVCSNSTWVTQTNSPQGLTDKKTGLYVPMLPQVSLLDNIGCVNVRSITEVGVGTVLLITSEPAARSYDGFRYSEVNLADKQVMSYIKLMAQFSCAHYDPISGWILWGAENV